MSYSAILSGLVGTETESLCKNHARQDDLVVLYIPRDLETASLSPLNLSSPSGLAHVVTDIGG